MIFSTLVCFKHKNKSVTISYYSFIFYCALFVRIIRGEVGIFKSKKERKKKNMYITISLSSIKKKKVLRKKKYLYWPRKKNMF